MQLKRMGQQPGGGGALPYISYTGMCGPSIQGMVFRPSAHKQGLKFKDF